MSVRAYKIIKIEVEDSPTFNVWEDDWLIEYANNSEDYEDGGQLEFERETILEAYEAEKDENKKKVLGAVLKDFECGRIVQDFVTYDCY